MPSSDLPILSLLIFLPPAAGLGLFLLQSERLVCVFALAAGLLELTMAAGLLFTFDPSKAGMQRLEQAPWIPSLNMEYLLGVDGISVLFLPLTALLTVAVILASWRSVRHLPKLYFALLLALEGITQGIYCALDLGLFFLFWELTLVPIFFLVSLWGIGPQRRFAATQYFLFMLAGGVFLLLGFILLSLNHATETAVSLPAGLSFNYMELLETPISLPMQSTVFLLLFIGFAFKAPLFPLHSWLPTMAMEGPVGITALLMGLKLGLFGIIRFAIPLAPQAAHEHFGLLATLGVVGALYGALIALKQTNLRQLLAFSSISHVGFVLIGIATLSIQGIQGAVFQLFNFGIVAGGLFLVAGFLQHRLGSTELTALGGVARPMPILASLFFILGLASLGVPGSNGFAAEHLILIGALKADAGLGIAGLLAVILGAAYFLGYFQKAFLGPLTHATVAESADLRPRELIIAAVFTGLALLLGLFPQPLLNLTEKPLQAWVQRLDSGHPMTLAQQVAVTRRE